MPLDQLPQSQASQARRKLFRSTKSYGHAEGLTCAFRQWRATHSHCRLLHGYALGFRFVFVGNELDQHNWCFDFGGLKPIKAWLHETFDHKLLAAADDPELAEFEHLAERGIIALKVLPSVGCEAVAQFVFDHVTKFVAETTCGRVRLEQVEVSEHSGNSASYSEECSEPLRALIPARTVSMLKGGCA